MAIVRISGEDALKLKSTTDWKAVDALTDEQIIEAAKNDPDSALPTAEQWKKFTRFHFPAKKTADK